MEKLLTIDDVSRIFGVSKTTVYRWVHFDYIPYIKIGGVLRFEEKSVLKWLNARKHSGRARLNIDWDTSLRE